MKEMLLKIAKEKNLEPTENFDKIVNAKKRFGLTIECPCDKNNKERYCISPLCMDDIERDSVCHCQMWCKK